MSGSLLLHAMLFIYVLLMVYIAECRFSESAPNVVHMSVKPADAMEDDDTAKAGSKSSIRQGRDSAEREPGCRCVIL